MAERETQSAASMAGPPAPRPPDSRPGGRTAAASAGPILVGEFRWRGYDWIVVRWHDEEDFDIIRADVPYTWRGKEVDEREV